MFKELFINATILISFVSIVYQIFRNTGLSRRSSLGHRILLGAIMGSMGIPLIIFGVNVNHTMVDFRNIALILSAFSGGFASVAVSGMIMGVFRILHGGITSATIAADLAILGIIIGIGWISTLKTAHWKKWAGMLLCSTTMTSLDLLIIIPDMKVKIQAITNFWIGTIIVGLLIFYYVEFLSSYRKMTLKWKNEATKDYLTGLFNVREYDRVFNKMSREAQEKGRSLSLLFIDIDFFKKINDTYGHVQGDQVLKELGTLLLKNCRETEKVFRVGGEEMAILLPNCSLIKAAEIAERIRQAVAIKDFHTSSGDPFRITISIGVASYPEQVAKPEDLIEAADNALYKAKRGGRNQVQYI